MEVLNRVSEDCQYFLSFFKSFSITTDLSESNVVPWQSNIHVPFFNGGFITRPSSLMADIVHEYDTYFTKKKLPFCIGQEARFASAESDIIFKRKNFTDSVILNAYLLKIEDYTPRANPLPSNIRIQRITTAAEFDIHTEMVATVHHINLDDFHRHYKPFAIDYSLREHAHYVSFLAFLDNKPVGTASIMVFQTSEGSLIAGNWNATVIEEARGQGIGIALANARLHLAEKIGVERVYTYMKAESKALSYSEKLGFKPYNQYQFFMKTPRD